MERHDKPTNDVPLSPAEIAGFMNWRGPGAYTIHTERRLIGLIAEAVKREREACAKACEEIETDRWNLYKGRKPYTGAEHGRASAHTQSESCGASACADAIRARGGE